MPERPVEQAGRQLLPRRTLRAGRRERRLGEPEVGVRIAGPERGQRLVPQVSEDVGAVEVQVLQQVTGVVGQAAAVGEQVGQGHVAADPGALEGEPRVVRAHGVVPGDGLVPDRAGDHGRGQRLGHRRELEHRVRVHRRRLAHAAYAEPPEVDDAVPVDHAERHPGHTGLRHGVVDHAVEPAERGVDLGGGEQWGRLRGRRGRERRGGILPTSRQRGPCPDRWPRRTRRAGAPAPRAPERPVVWLSSAGWCRGCWSHRRLP